MKALQCVELGGVDKLEINEVSSPVVGPGQVLIGVKAASVNFPDVLMIQGYINFNLRFLLHLAVKQLGLLKRLVKV